MKWQGRPKSDNIVDIRNSNQFELFLHDSGNELSGIGRDLVDTITGPFSQKEYIVFPTNHQSSYTPSPGTEAQLRDWQIRNNIPVPEIQRAETAVIQSRMERLQTQMSQPRVQK